MKKLFVLLLCFSSTAWAQQSPTTLLGTYKFDNKEGSPNAKVFKENASGFIFYKADFDLDVDGSPFAYHPKNTGLLHNANGGGTPPTSSVIYYYKKGMPYIQIETDPAPGYYLSMTSLKLQHYAGNDHRRYVHPDSVTYFVLPGGKFSSQGVRTGDLALVYNTRNNTWAYAIYADSGPGKIIGEGSTLLAKKLGIPTKIDAKGRVRGGLDSGDVLYIVFPGSGKGPEGYPTLDDTQVTELGKKAIAGFGSEENLIQRFLGFYNK